MILLDGKKVRDERMPLLAAIVGSFATPPTLAIIQVGVRPDSVLYVNQKKAFGERIGIFVRHISLSEFATEADVMAEIEALNADPMVSGIILQSPIPKHLRFSFLVDRIDPMKDVDGLGAIQQAKLLRGDSDAFVPATAKGIMALLDAYTVPLSGKEVVVVGRSLLVGRPFSLLALSRDATVTTAHSKTAQLSQVTSRAVILVVAAGHAGLIGKEHVSPGQTVIDVGISAIDSPGGRVVSGDVRFDEVKSIVGAITPVPGGVGPMTVLSLFENVVSAHSIIHKK